MRVLAVLLAVLALAGAGSAATNSGLRGTARRGPITPVCSTGRPCDGPAKHTAIVFVRNGVSRRATTDVNGHYRISLPPGAYAVRIPTGRFGFAPKTAVVPEGRVAVRNFSIDTGIR